MTTHELAAFLEGLSSLLRSVPDRPLLKTRSAKASPSPNKILAKSSGRNISSISLAGLSNFTKVELLELIEQHRIPIYIDKKDSATKVMSRLMRYLEKNQNVKKTIRNRVAHGRTSPQLTQALSYLLKDTYE